MVIDLKYETQYYELQIKGDFDTWYFYYSKY